MEKANKTLEEEKTLTKVARPQRESPATKRQHFSHDSTDLRSFWTRAPLLSTAAGEPNASSCTPGTDKASNQTDRSNSSQSRKSHNFKGSLTGSSTDNKGPVTNSSSKCCMYFGQDKYCTIPYSWLLFTSPFGQALILLAQLAGYNSRPVGPAISPGILFGAGIHSSPANH